MKHKYIFRTMTALCAALLIVGGLSVPAYAQTPEGQDATNDDNVIVEQPKEDTPPLTPEGNAALVDDYGGNKQLITVTTKAGNYFYILIDRANEDNETAVHFLNQVDEADLMALMEDGQSAEEPLAVCNCTEKCETGAVNTKCEVCSKDMTGCTGKEPEPKTPEEPAEPEKKESAGLNPAVLLLVLAVMSGAVFAYFKFIKGQANNKNSSNPDDYDYEDGEEMPDEEEIELEDEESDELDADGGGGEESEDDTP